MKSVSLRLNPIIVKEFRSRMRGWRAFAILTAYLVFLSLFSYGIYRVVLLSTQYGGPGVPLSPFIGQALYVALANLSLFFVAFLTPALTAGAVSSEHEKLTMEMLQATPLAPHTILWGKLISAAGYILLLLFAAVPLLSLVFTFGGVTLTDLLQAVLVILATAITFGMIGLFFSAWRRRTIQAIVFSYLVILTFVGGTYVIYIFWGIMIRDTPPRYVLLANPFSALASVFAGTGSYQSGNMLAGMFGLLSGMGPTMVDPNQAALIRPLWHYTLALYLVLSTGLYLLTTRFIKPIRPWRIHWQGALIVGLIILIYLGLGGAIFQQDIQSFISPPPETPTPAPVPPMVAPAIPVRPVPTAAPVATATPTPTAEPD